ncbi:hypothetical protein HDV03_002147 [Kappamyces sp. JEL0829]|nr:hypothetical protein HDV03_002147 [Kappamyces sp. JEL0829]
MAAVLLFATLAQALIQHTVAPQMGWNTWNKYGCNIDQHLILSQAKAMVAEGLLALGYEYVLIDDCWMKPVREANGTLAADPARFPDGMLHLTRSIHALGLKVGIYSSAGVLTCAGFPGSLDMEAIDAAQYAAWEFDYLKYDNCFNQGRSGTPKLSFDRYNAMYEALLDTDRPFLYSLCNWGEDGPWTFAQTIANSWRMSGDIADSFAKHDDRCPCVTNDCALHGYHCSVLNILDKAASVLQKNRIGHYNDLDMLEVGNGGMTFREYQTHFSAWAFVKSPLILGNDLTAMDAETKSIIANKHIIALNQDALGGQANRVWKKNDLQLWFTPLANMQGAIMVLNTGGQDTTVDLTFKEILADFPQFSDLPFEAFDLWNDAVSMGVKTGSLGPLEVPSHGCRVLRLVPAVPLMHTEL